LERDTERLPEGYVFTLDSVLRFFKDAEELLLTALDFRREELDTLLEEFRDSVLDSEILRGCSFKPRLLMVEVFPRRVLEVPTVPVDLNREEDMLFPEP
jgi:hypothetical protein